MAKYDKLRVDDNTIPDCAHCVRQDHCWSVGVCNLAHVYYEICNTPEKAKMYLSDYQEICKKTESVERFCISWIFTYLYRCRRLINSPIKVCAMVAKAVQRGTNLKGYNISSFMNKQGNLGLMGLMTLFFIPVEFLQGKPEKKWSKEQQRKFIDFLVSRRS